MPNAESSPLLSSSPQHSPASTWRDKVTRTRRLASWYIGSKWAHYIVIVLTTIDVGCIFADFILSLYLCEQQQCGRYSDRYDPQRHAKEVLEVVSLVISCLFMFELATSVWALGLTYFKSWFRCLDAAVILASFALETGLKNMFEEVGSTIVILRLWRVFQIVEEFGAGAQEQMEGLYERIEELEKEKQDLQNELTMLRQ